MAIRRVENPADEDVASLEKEGVIRVSANCTALTKDGGSLKLPDAVPPARWYEPGEPVDPLEIRGLLGSGFVVAVARGTIIPIVEVDATPGREGNVTWALGFLRQVAEASAL